MKLYTLDGYAFENKILTDGTTLYCDGESCLAADFEEMLRNDYKECLLDRHLDREATFNEYLTRCITGFIIKHDVKLCDTYRKEGYFN